MKVEGIIVRISQYKDNDAMVNVLTKDGLISFYSRGIYKIDNKNSILNSSLMMGEFTFADNKNDKLTYKEFSPIIDTRLFITDFNKLVAINFINEVTLKLFNDDDMYLIYPYLCNTLKVIDKGDIPSLLIAYFASSLRLAGYGLNVDSCVKTNSTKDIVAVSYNDGGFISREAYRPTEHKLYTPSKCLLLRKIFKIRPEAIKDVKFSNNDIKQVLNDLFIYTYDQTGIRFISEKLIDKLI